MKDRFDIPIVIFIFLRQKAVEVIQRIAQVQPKKLYIMADNGRNDTERLAAEECRHMVENAITWDCEIIKNYSEENRGVYANIGLGAKWVLEREKSAIFLEDDNLPELSFFPFCKELLERYEHDTRILWICGTNYLGEYKPEDKSSYVFTKHMMPCGWASWSEKFIKFYDGEVKYCNDKNILSKIKKQYYNNKLFKQYSNSWTSEYKRIQQGKRPASWDFQMDYSIKLNSLYGISPCRNQIKNIGADALSTHGGSSMARIMTKRFCGMGSYQIEFPLKHPLSVLPDEIYERKIYKILLHPFRLRAKYFLLRGFRKIFRIPDEIKTSDFIKNKFGNK